jgi:hypothetical protein
MATDIPNSIMKGLTKVFSPGSSGSKGPSVSNFEDSAPTWDELSEIVAAERQRLNLPPPDLVAVSLASSYLLGNKTCRLQVLCYAILFSGPKLA